MKDHIVPLLKDNEAKSFMKSLEKSKLKPYSDEQRKRDEENIAKILERNEL